MTQKKPVNKNKTWNILRRVLLAMIGIVIGILIYFWNAHSLVGNRIPMPFGYGAAVVLSGSMEPTISVNDLILVKEADKYAVGDIVVFQDRTDIVVHRIVAVGDGTVQTKGDANSAMDAPISTEMIKGRVFGHIAGIGAVIQIAKTPIGIILILATAFLLLEFSYRKEKQQDEDDLEKIKEEIRKLKEEQE